MNQTVTGGNTNGESDFFFRFSITNFCRNIQNMAKIKIKLVFSGNNIFCRKTSIMPNFRYIGFFFFVFFTYFVRFYTDTQI